MVTHKPVLSSQSVMTIKGTAMLWHAWGQQKDISLVLVILAESKELPLLIPSTANPDSLCSNVSRGKKVMKCLITHLT